MHPTAALVVGAIALALLPLDGAGAQPLVKVKLEFRQSATRSRDAVEARGGVIITERGAVRPRARVDVDSRETRTRQSTGVFTLVQSGGESTLTVATEVPYQQVTLIRDYLTGHGYLATGVVFREVGTSLKVHATVVGGDRVRVRVMPVISYAGTDGRGTIEVTRLATEVVARSGQPLVVGGGTSETTSAMRRILGFSDAASASETTLVLTATIQ